MKYYPVAKLNEIALRIVELMPALEPFFISEDAVLENSKKLYTYIALDKYKQRQKYFVSLIRKKIGSLFSKEELEQIQIPLSGDGLKGGVVDHHGILNHPVLIGANIVPHFFRMFDRNVNGDILTFATGNVPLNDPFHRRGFMIDGRKVNLFSRADKHKIVYGLDKYDFPRKFPPNTQDLIDAIDFSSCHTLGDQITKINFYLWPLLFERSFRRKISNLISLEYDDMVIEYLLHVLETDQGSFIYQMLFDNSFRTRLIDYFQGRTGAWDEANNRGTHFFWGLGGKHEQLRMKLKNSKLQSTDGSFEIAWNLEELTRALRYKQILPGMLLKFSLILFYMGLKPFAGYGSANYLSVLQKDFLEFLRSDFPDEVSNIRELTVNNVTSIPVLLRHRAGKIEDYFAFDIITNGGLPESYFKTLNSVPLKYFMAVNLNRMYDYAFNLYGQGEKETVVATEGDYERLLSKTIL